MAPRNLSFRTFHSFRCSFCEQVITGRQHVGEKTVKKLSVADLSFPDATGAWYHFSGRGEGPGPFPAAA